MPPQKFQQLSMPVVDVFLSIEEQILVNIAKRLRKHQSLMDEDIQSWQLQQLNELGSLRQENIRTIAKHSGMSINAVTKMLEQAGYSTIEKREGTLQAAVAAGLLIQPPSIPESPALDAILSAYQEQAKQTFNLINSTMLDQANGAYVDILNRTVGKVLAGTQTPQDALRETVSEWAEKGVPALKDKAGREWSAEAYVSLVTRSMSNNVANEMQDTRIKEYGVDLVEISSHMGARPKCFPYQGSIFSMSGNDPKYPAFSTTSYGQPDGLFGINCRHVKYPFIPGISEQRYEQYDEEENEEVYIESQKQRYLERRIKKAKRERRMMEAMGDEVGAKRAQNKIRNRQQAMRDFIDDTERTRRYNREQVY
jgi:hypothetical protein